MKAMVLEKSAPVEALPLQLRDVPEPDVGQGQVLIGVDVCGVCHTDLHEVEGDLTLPRLPIIPGHQIVGRVAATGEGVSSFLPGDRVGVTWLHQTCGQCDFCRRGQENLCESAVFTGYSVDGGYAEQVVAPAAFTYKVSETLPSENLAPFLCGGIIGYRALRLSEIEPGGRVGLYGFGSSAHIALQIARHWNCEVYVFTRSRNHRNLAMQMGAHWVGGAEDDPPHLLDAAVIFAPAGRLVHDALRVLRKGGTIALAGITMSPIPEMQYSLLYHERTVRSVANSTRKDVEELLALADAIPLRTHVEEFTLAEANEALRALKESRLHASGVLHIRD